MVATCTKVILRRRWDGDDSRQQTREEIQKRSMRDLKRRTEKLEQAFLPERLQQRGGHLHE